MRKYGLVVLVAVFVGLAARVHPDAPLPPPEIIERCSGRYCAAADPKANVVVVRQGTISERGNELWHVDGWERYFEVSNDGEYLVACYGGGNLLPLKYDAAWPMIRVYRRGKLVRALPLSEVVRDLSKLKRTVSHYDWGSCIGFASDQQYEIETADRGRLRFTLPSGALEPGS